MEEFLKKKPLRRFLSCLIAVAMVLITGIPVTAEEDQKNQQNVIEYSDEEEYTSIIASEDEGEIQKDHLNEQEEKSTLSESENKKQKRDTQQEKANITSHILEIKDLPSDGISDKTKIKEGTTFENGYFKVIGDETNIYRTNSDGSLKAIEIGKNETGAIQFTTTGDTTVMLKVSSTGSTNQSAIGLTDSDGTLLTNEENISVVEGTSETILHYIDLPEGTYQIISPEDTALNRGVRLFSVSVEEAVKAVTSTYRFDATQLDATGVADKDPIAEGISFADGYFKVSGKVTQRVSSSTGLITSVEVDKASNGFIEFTVTGTADVAIEMSSTGGSNTSSVGLIDSEGATVENREGIFTVTGTSKTELTYQGLPSGTYRVVSPQNENYNRGARLYTIEVVETTKGERPERKAWEEVDEPIIDEVKGGTSSITVSYTMEIGYDGADSVTITMYDESGKPVGEKSVASDGKSGEVSFLPEASGNYAFCIEAKRADENNTKKSEMSEAISFILPLLTPSISSVTSAGGGSVRVVWSEVREADGYLLTVEGTEISVKTDKLEATISGLTIGSAYTIYVYALRGEEKSDAAKATATATEEAQRVWSFSAFGSNANKTDNGYEGSANNGEVRVYSAAGKLVPASTDGLAFYYTTIDPEQENFILSAKVKVNNWTLSNGQEGFGLMAADAVGENGDTTTFWNNSYMASVTKVEYYWDGSSVSDSGDKISMKLGVGAQEKKGVTAENIAAGNTIDSFRSIMSTLETSCAEKGSGTYNLIGNYKNSDAPTGTVENVVKEFDMEIQRDNTGYRLRYTDAAGNTMEKLYYDTERENLTQIDPDHIYLGFFASRNADITVTDIYLTTSDPKTDPPAEGQEITYITPSYVITSTKDTGSADYEMVYYGNADGMLKITDSNGTEIANEAVLANTEVKKAVALRKGINTFTVTFTPDKDYKPGEYQLLSSYEIKKFEHIVRYRTYGKTNQSIYVAPDGNVDGKGTKDSPLDIYTAVKYVQPGQVIVLRGGTYQLTRTIKVERGIDGTEDSMIYMVASEEDLERPVFDFGGACAGMVLAGDYWYFKGFDVTNSADAQKGLQLSGSYCVLDQINAYHNGNTGIQLSRYLSTDEWENWPSNNLILNCTSYGNADKGYEDADGFAAKLTVADGNVFDGCIAHHNADDGWDLFAKIESGNIGKVVLKNCIAYENGYLEDGTVAGNGNGFKLGGSSMSGYHTLMDSIAFGNKTKGIDSNSCPDIQVYRCTSFNNGSFDKKGNPTGANVAFYTKDAANTDFFATGLLSYRTEKLMIAEQLKPKGTQDINRYINDSNYYWDIEKGGSYNKSGNKAEKSWFIKLPDDNTIEADEWIERNADGTIDMKGFFALSEEVPEGVGARIGGTSSKEIPIPEEVTETILSNWDENDDDDDRKEPSTVSIQKEEVKEELGDTTGSWIQNEQGFWWYQRQDGTWPKDGWLLVQGKWYAFNENGYMKTGWMQTADGKWYFLNDTSGVMCTGWTQIGEHWYLFDKKNGAMRTGWIQLQGSFYLLDEKTGFMKMGWVQDEKGDWYFLDDTSGAMRTGWTQIEGKWYYLQENGVMAASCVTPDGYTLDEDGVWLP